ncbi:murein DD-endopeptidase MepM/ murein hydrolase activator NlpD [Prauserella isguenensis]|uniref:Murein DD-endopeptidase MepM/ murein hydrolase activator NlpD n=1 Tax=Prauserella isguenensis TaxID=1470180 RepID=A0A839S1D4_9PSEU|nr:M23 family metallopeptidase [Prauserella isguenensis]MBB3051566.1 murein DD-endopeptidase MepM/ murein hydrolase activator NlpD [Prauserella isguenensis]
MSAPHALSRAAAVALATLALVVAPTTPVHGQESPGDLEAARSQLSEAQAALAQTYQRYGDAQRKHDRTQRAAQQARTRAEQTRGAAEAAAARVRGMRGDVDRFASASFRQGSTIGSISAYLGAESTTEMLERSSLLNAISDDQLSILDRMRTALEKRRSSQRQATAALREASQNERAAETAKAEAQRAFRAAKAKKQEAQSEIDRLSAATAQVSAAPGGAAKPAEGELTSTYGARWGTVHYGIDIANSIGTPIHSTLPGEVIDAGTASGFGMWVRVQHSDGLVSVYGHIDQATVSVGQQVGAGEQIATMGNRGQSTGPHLHFEIHENGNKIDPLPWLRSRGVDI